MNIELTESDGNVFFTSDHHFFDDRFELMSRPFSSLNEMHELMILNHNKVVKENDIVFFLGDIVRSDSLKSLEIVKRLNGRKALTTGNYDKFIVKDYFKYFDEGADSYINLDLNYETNKYRFHLNHYPNMAVKNRFNLVGHIHGAWKVSKNMINVGVDVNHFRPFSLEKILFHCNGIRQKYYDENVFICGLNGNQEFKDPIVENV